MKYQGTLEVAYLKKFLTQEHRIEIGRKRKDLGLTLEEANTIQIMVLGAPIGEVVGGGPLHTATQPSAATLPKPAPSTNEHAAPGSSLGIGGAIFMIIIFVVGTALLFIHPPSLIVVAGAAIVAGIGKLIKK